MQIWFKTEDPRLNDDPYYVIYGAQVKLELNLAYSIHECCPAFLPQGEDPRLLWRIESGKLPNTGLAKGLLLPCQSYLDTIPSSDGKGCQAAYLTGY